MYFMDMLYQMVHICISINVSGEIKLLAFQKTPQEEGLPSCGKTNNSKYTQRLLQEPKQNYSKRNLKSQLSIT
jgi:hypothetical protein